MVAVHRWAEAGPQRIALTLLSIEGKTAHDAETELCAASLSYTRDQALMKEM